MVDAVVSVFLEKLANIIAEKRSVFNEFSNEELGKLKTELQLMQSFLKDADKSKRKNETLRNIMARLRELVYEAEDILVDCQLQSVDHDKLDCGCLSTSFNPKRLPFQYQTGKRLREINEGITGIKQNITSYLGVPLLSQPMSMNDAQNHLGRSTWSSPLYDHTQVIGLEGDAVKLKEWLFRQDHVIQAIGILGMGGVGKTTIAQKVFHDRQVEEWFERRLWVSVSQTFTEEQIMRSMLRNLGDASVGDDQGEMLKKINQYLLGRRYLIVLDDVWSLNISWWQKIFEGLPKENGNSVIVTTRNEKIAQKMGVEEARTHWPKLLSQDDSWLLFCRIAFAASEGKCMDSELETIGKEIVGKCKGLPLAIKALGGMMLCKQPYYHEWRRIADNFRDELAENDDSVMASLQLSFDELPSYLKSCFLCLSLYPEDCTIGKEQLVHWWIAEGFSPSRSRRLSTEDGEDCFSGLVNRCLVEVVDKTFDGIIHTCKTHDMVRDLAINMASYEAFFAKDVATTRRLAIKSDVHQKQHLVANKKLRAFLSTTKTGEVNKVASSDAKKFCECPYVLVLDLSKTIFETPLTSLLDRIGFLKHLTFLSLSNTHPLVHLPPSLAKLQKLRILDLSYCQNLKALPAFVTNFEELTVLDVSYCGSLKYLPKGLGRLSNLEVLLGFKPSKSSQLDGCRIAELVSLTRLRKLGLQVTRADQIGDNEVNALVNLQQLQFFELSCFDSDGSDLINKLEKLLPPHQLHELCLKYYPGKTSPVWLSPFSLPMLQYLSISSGNLTNMSESFWGDNSSIWKIKGLMLESASDLGIEWSMLHKAMPLLRIMNISWCPELESFPIDDVGFRGGVWKAGECKN